MAPSHIKNLNIESDTQSSEVRPERHAIKIDDLIHHDEPKQPSWLEICHSFTVRYLCEKLVVNDLSHVNHGVLKSICTERICVERKYSVKFSDKEVTGQNKSHAELERSRRFGHNDGYNALHEASTQMVREVTDKFLEEDEKRGQSHNVRTRSVSRKAKKTQTKADIIWEAVFAIIVDRLLAKHKDQSEASHVAATYLAKLNKVSATVMPRYVDEPHTIDSVSSKCSRKRRAESHEDYPVPKRSKTIAPRNDGSAWCPEQGLPSPALSSMSSKL